MLDLRPCTCCGLEPTVSGLAFGKVYCTDEGQGYGTAAVHPYQQIFGLTIYNGAQCRL